MPVLSKKKRLKKELTLFDVYAISTGAMFSSGFFLLPGLASAEAGPAVVLAYFLGGIMVLPAMISAAELSTAMPRAGGPYYFLDRSLGPMIGTVGGLGTWLALIFKSAFALIGMGAYLSIFMNVPIKPIAIGFTLIFMILNITGVKKSGQVQGALVVTLVGILVFFVVFGLYEIFSLDVGEITREQFTPFMPFGTEGLISTVGLIFVSYAGLTQVASVSEEVKNPERNIPLGMLLSLLTATVIYVLGVYVMVALLDADALREDLTPVATAANAFLDWMPWGSGLILIVIAAVAAFASTGNAGIMSAARYPFAMARDRLVWKAFSKVGKFKTPTVAILITSVAMIFFILVLDVADIAKLASAFMLLIFGFLNVAVIIMREKGLRKEDPYEKVTARALVFDFSDEKLSFEQLIKKISERLSEKIDLDEQTLIERFSKKSAEGMIPIGKNSALKHIRVDEDIESEMALVRFKKGIYFGPENFEPMEDEEAKKNRKLYAMIFLVSSKKKSGQHLRILAHLAEMIDSIDFTDRWLSAEDPAELREILLRDERFINIIIKRGDITEEMIGKTIRELELPGESLITIIKRQGEIIFPHGKTIIQEDDELSIIGESEDIEQLNQTVSNSGNDK